MESRATNTNREPRPAVLQRRVLNYLSCGGKRSAADIARALYLCDPRGHIAQLRKKGHPILDEWRTSEEGNRFKVYFVPENK